MDTSAIQSEIASLPPAASLGNATSPGGEAAFKNALDRAMNKNNSMSEPESSQTSKDKKSGKAKSPGAEPDNAPTLQIPAVLIAAASANFQTGGGSGNISQLSWLTRMMPDHGSILASQAAGAGADSAGSDGSQLTPLSTSPLVPGASVLTDEEDNFAKRAPATQAQDHSEAESTALAAFAQSSNESTQQAVTALEDLKLGLLATGTASASSSAKVKDAPLYPASAERTSANSVDASTLLHSKPEAGTTPHNPGKDSGNANADASQAGQAGSNSASPSVAAGSSAGDSTSDGRSSQDLAARHSDAAGTTLSGNASTAASFASTMGSTAMLSSNAAPAPVAQATPANGLPAGATASSQPPVSHAAGNSMTSAADNPLSAAGVVNSASLLQAQGRTAMHVSLQTDSLGPLELHAVLDGGKVGASIAVVNHDAHTLLTNELPALQQVLSDQNLRVEHLSVLSSPMSSGTGTGKGGGFQDFSQPRGNTARWYSTAPAQTAAPSNEYLAPEVLRGRLSVRA